MSGVRSARISDAPAVVTILAHAFFDDPVATFLFPDVRRRPALLDRFFDLQLTQNYLRRGVVSTTDDGAGAALWMPPDAPSPTIRERLFHSAFAFRLGERRGAAHRLTALLESRHPREPHWYLGAIGVEPDRQGRGVGTALLEAGLARCDERGEGAYLEASRPESARLYERVGFSCRELLVPASAGVDGPALYLMYRDGKRS